MAETIIRKKPEIDQHITMCISDAAPLRVRLGFRLATRSAQPHFARPRILSYASASL